MTLAARAVMHVTGADGRRAIAASDFFTGWMSTALAPGEVLIAAEFPVPGPFTGSSFVEVARRHGDFAIVGVGAVLTVEGEMVTASTISIAGAGQTPLRATEAEHIITGRAVTDDALRAAGEAAAAATKPIADLHASVGYKQQLTSVLTRRALRRAYERARTAA